jgi:hypothetical protein
MVIWNCFKNFYFRAMRLLAGKSCGAIELGVAVEIDAVVPYSALTFIYSRVLKGWENIYFYWLRPWRAIHRIQCEWSEEHEY